MSNNNNINSRYLDALTKFSKEEIEAANRAADHWYYNIGPNVIPADTKIKKAWILNSWEYYKTNPVPQEVFEEWKQSGLFAYGIAVVMGNIWRGPNAGRYINLVDADNGLAITKLCSRNGKTITVQQLAEWTLVEQHKDDPNSAHIYIISDKPFPTKASDIGKPGYENRIESNQIPGIEVKSVGGLSYAWNSIHEGGFRYEFVNGLDNPVHCEDYFKHINDICVEYGLEYLDSSGNPVGDIPIAELFKPDTVIYTGNNRHKQFLRVCDSLIRRNREILTLDKIKKFALEYNNGPNFSEPLNDVDVDGIWNQAVEFIAKNTYEQQPELKSEKQQQQQTQDTIKKFQEDSKSIRDRDYVGFIFRCAKKKVLRDDYLIKRILYFAFSTYTNDPTNLAVLSPTSTGKTHPVTSVLDYFPKDDVRFIGKMSTMALVRERGVLIDSKGNDITNQVRYLKTQLKRAQRSSKRKDSIEGEDFILNDKDGDSDNIELQLSKKLDEVLKDSKILIDVSNKVLVFLEPPNMELWDLLKPILSHDRSEIEFPYVNKTASSGLETLKVVVRGAPVCIFCSTKDESKTEWWDEIESRFYVTSPNIVEQKFREVNELTASRKGLPRRLKKIILVKDTDESLAKRCVEQLKAQILHLCKDHLLPSEIGNDLDDSVWIPFKDELVKFLPSKEGADMRSVKKIFSIIETIALTNAHRRHKLRLQVKGDDEPEETIIANLHDLYEALQIFRDVSGTPAYKVDFFWKYFVPYYKSKNGVPDIGKNGKEENICGATTKQMADYFKEHTRIKVISAENIYKTYFKELVAVGYLDYVQSEINGKQNLFYPVIDITSTDGNEDHENDFRPPETEIVHDIWCSSEFRIKTLKNQDQFLNVLQDSPLLTSHSFNIIPQNWLELQISALFSYGIEYQVFEIIEPTSNKPISVFRFIGNYVSRTLSSNLYEKTHVFAKYYNIMTINKDNLTQICDEHAKAQRIRPNSSNSLSNSDFDTKPELIADTQPPEQSTDKKAVLEAKAHWSGSLWYCKTCKYRDDKFGMLNHVCKNKEEQPPT